MLDKKQKIILLFKKIGEGDTAAFNELFNTYHQKLLSFAQQYTKEQEAAEEITSELFVKIWIKRESITTVLHPEVYLFVSIKNACLNYLRSAKKRNLQPVEDFEEELAHNNELIEEKELIGMLNRAVKELPMQRQLIFKLIKEDGLSSKAVAQILGISIRTVENQLYKAIKTLAEQLSVYLGYHPQKKQVRKQLVNQVCLLFF